MKRYHLILNYRNSGVRRMHATVARVQIRALNNKVIAVCFEFPAEICGLPSRIACAVTGAQKRKFSLTTSKLTLLSSLSFASPSRKQYLKFGFVMTNVLLLCQTIQNWELIITCILPYYYLMFPLIYYIQSRKHLIESTHFTNDISFCLESPTFSAFPSQKCVSTNLAIIIIMYQKLRLLTTWLLGLYNQSFNC
jgi:hypothetical protein